MKIKKANDGHLSNFEVLDLLRSRGASKDPTRVMSLLMPSEFKVYDYLVESPACDQTRECISEFLEKFKEYQLAKSEVFNILNNRPSSAVELAPLIEALEQRDWDEDKLNEMAELIVQVLPPRPGEPNLDEGDAEDNAAQVAEDNAAENNAEDMEADGDNAEAGVDNAEDVRDTS